MNKIKWKIFIITHGPIIEEYYSNDKSFSNENYVFFNVSKSIINRDQYEIINMVNLPNFINLGKCYAEGEAIYNIYKNNLFEGYDYIGFIHWDYELKSYNPLINHKITSTLERAVAQKDKFISFSTYDFWKDYNQRIMMDHNFPNQLVGNGRNCYDTIIEDYNVYFGTNIDLEYLQTKRINLCSAFMCELNVFKELMGFYCSIIEGGKLNDFDLNHQHRFQGGMLERYIGCYSHQFNITNIELYHNYIKTKNKNKFKTILKKLLIKVKSN